MYVATIVPVPHLSLVKDDPYHLCLSHVVSESKEYKEFYLKQSRLGKYLIIDNGAAEGACQGIEKIAANAESVGAHEVVLPDEIYDKKKTLQMSEQALDYLYKKHVVPPWNIMVVPQGETFEEWCECVEIMLQWPVNVIGISKFITPKYEADCGTEARMCAVKHLEKIGVPIDIHLLGCWYHPAEIGKIVYYSQTMPEQVLLRGTDSAIAFVYATAQELLFPTIARPKIEVDFLKGQADLPLLIKNKELWVQYSTNLL